jgi:chromosome segregation ATPase
LKERRGKMSVFSKIILCLLLMGLVLGVGYWYGSRDSTTELQRLRDQGAKAAADLSAARTAEQQATERLGKLQEQYTGLETDYLNLGKRYKDLESRVDSIQSGIGEVKSEVAAVERGIDESQGLAAESGKLIGELRKELQ